MYEARTEWSPVHLEISIRAGIVHKYSAPSLRGHGQQLGIRAHSLVPFHDPRMNRERLVGLCGKAVMVHPV